MSTVNVTISVKEVNSDSEESGVFVYNKAASINISITEIKSINAGAVAIVGSVTITST